MTSTFLAIARNRKRVDTMLLEPYYAKAVERRFAPRARLKRLQRAYVDWDRLLDSLSRGMLDILQRLRAGHVRRAAPGTSQARHHREPSRLCAHDRGAPVGIVPASEPADPASGRWCFLLGAAAAVGTILLGLRVLRAVDKSGGLKDAGDAFRSAHSSSLHVRLLEDPETNEDFGAGLPPSEVETERADARQQQA